MTYDLIMVGSGFSGTFFLKKYRERFPQAKVLVLERGRKASHGERILAAREEKGLPNYPNMWEAALQKNKGNHAYYFDLSFGGGSNSWWACTPRFLPQDFQMKSLYGLGEDWPLSYEDLEPYYELSESWIEVSGPSQTIFPKKSPYPLAPHHILPFDRQLQQKYGLLVHAQPTARSSKGGSRSRCCVNSTCHVCPIQSKFSIAEHFASPFEGVELLTGAQAFSLEMENGLAKSVLYLENGREKAARGEMIVLAANPIFNSHIMLNAGDLSPALGQGLGEQRSLYADLMLGMDNRGGSSTITSNMWMLYEGDFRRERASCLIESHNPPEMIRLEKGKLRHLARFKFIWEDLYDPRNKVERTDSPYIPQVSYAGPSDYLQRGKKSLPGEMEKLMADMPVEEIRYDRELSSGESHIIGGHIMGENGVVDDNQVHHHYRNVLMLGAGSFPTMTASNPTLTLCAMAIRSADKI